MKNKTLTQKELNDIIKKNIKEIISFWIGYLILITVGVLIILMMIYGIYITGYNIGFKEGKINGSIESFNEVYDFIDQSSCDKELSLTKVNGDKIYFRSKECPDGAFYDPEGKYTKLLNLTSIWF